MGRAKITEIQDGWVEILNLASEGKSDKAIAREMGITYPSVKKQVRRLLVFLGCKNKTHAVAFALRKGIIE